MRRSFLVCVVLLSAVSLSSAQRHNQAVMMRMPFDFDAVGHQLPAGDYYVWQKQKNQVVIWQISGSQAIEMSTAEILRPVATAEPKVFFLDMNGQKRLWRYFPAGSNTGIEVSVPGFKLATNRSIPKTSFVSDKATLLKQYIQVPARLTVQQFPQQREPDTVSLRGPQYRRNK
jgi:hypothetical protein